MDSIALSVSAGVDWHALGFALGLLVLAVLDPVRIDRAFIHDFDYDTWAAPSPNIRAVLERERQSDEPYRMLSYADRGQDVVPAFHGIELASGHHPNDLARYRDVIGMVGSSLPVNLVSSANVLRILNVRYILWPDRIGAPEDQGLPAAVTDNLERVSQTTMGGQPYETLYRFTDLPRARLVGDAVVLPDGEAVPFILSDDFDPATQVVLDTAPPLALPGEPIEGSVEWLKRGNNRLKLRVTTSSAGLLVIADNWFPAWKARVGDEDVAVRRANHTLRAVPVPAGEHDVELYYRSPQLAWSLRLTILSLALVSLLTGVDWLMSRRREAAR